MTKYFLNIVVLLIFSKISFSQGEAALPFLLIPPSPKLNGLGAVGVSFPTDDAFAFYFNPAQLGLSNNTFHLTTHFYQNKINWLKSFDLDLYIHNVAFNFGYSFKNIINNMDLSLGFGLLNNKIYYGEFIATNPITAQPEGKYQSWDEYNSFAFGIGLHSNIDLSVGFGFKKVNSNLVDNINGSSIKEYKLKVTVYDLGIMINSSYQRMFETPAKFKISENKFLAPDLNISTGYSLTNIGDRIYYIDPAQADPVPRTARLGYTISPSLTIIDNNVNVNFNFLKVNFSTESQDILILRDTSGNSEYQSFLGDINIWDNLFKREGNKKVIVHKGFSIEFVETFEFNSGSFYGRGFDYLFTNGYGIKISGLLKLFSLLSNQQKLLKYLDYFDLQYYSAQYAANDWRQSEFIGFQIIIKNLPIN